MNRETLPWCPTCLSWNRIITNFKSDENVNRQNFHHSSMSRGFERLAKLVPARGTLLQSTSKLPRFPNESLTSASTSRPAGLLRVGGFEGRVCAKSVR